MLAHPKTESLSEKLLARTASTAVVGLGNVGLQVGGGFGRSGYQVLGIDGDAAKCSQVMAGIDYIKSHHHEMADLVGRGLLRASDDYQVLAEADVVIICVPTPLTKN